MKCFCKVFLVVLRLNFAYCEVENDDMEETDIYPELNDLDQEDPVLIQALREKILVKPPDPRVNPILYGSGSAKSLQGQFGQPIEVDKILK